MQAALYDIAFQNAVAEVGHGVGAIPLGGVERSVDVVDGNALVPHLEAFDVARWKIGGRADRNEIFCHGSTMREGDKCFSWLGEKFNRAVVCSRREPG